MDDRSPPLFYNKTKPVTYLISKALSFPSKRFLVMSMISRKKIINPSFIAFLMLLGVCQVSAGENWPGFRGEGNSVTDLDDLPLSWSDDENIAWKRSLKGYGQSSPVIWGDIVFATSAGGDKKETLFVEAFDASSGETIWEKRFAASQKPEEVSDMISRGAPSPVVDGGSIYAFFESGDLIALDHGGEARWKRSLTTEYGEFSGSHGIGASLVNTPKGIVVLVDHEGPSYLLLIDKETGENIWKVEREPRVSWATPLFLEHKEVPQVVVSSNGELASFALADGQKIWWFDGIKKNTVASPTTNGELVIVGSSEPGNSLAVRLGGEGDVTDSHLVWKAESVTSSFGSPLIHGESVYFVNRAGALQSTDLSDGSLQWKRRLPASTWASPLSAGERLYFFCKNGETVVHRSENLGKEIAPLAENPLTIGGNDRIYGYAVMPGRIVIRIEKELLSIGAKTDSR